MHNNKIVLVQVVKIETYTWQVDVLSLVVDIHLTDRPSILHRIVKFIVGEGD